MLLGVDVGGTFTDAVLLGADGAVHTAKVPSTPQDQSVGVLRAVEAVLDNASRAHSEVRRSSRAHSEVRRFAHGTTVATNALLQGDVARTALLATEGFTDVVSLGRQTRPHLYRLCDSPPKPLSTIHLPVPERMGPDGPIRALSPAQAQHVVDELIEQRPEAIAVVLLHSYADSRHEELIGQLISKALPEVHLSLSHQLIGTFREYERAASTEVDAALSPLLSNYLRKLGVSAKREGLPPVEVMQSSGGLADADTAASHAALTVLSGPAGGVGGALLLARSAGFENVLCLDMGGTSCDVCLVSDGSVSETAERTVSGRPIALPALDIHTVGAGGGSIAWADEGGALRVGPRSAGAVPGPACYGNGGSEPTVTDANLLLGRLLGDSPLAGGVQLDLEAARGAVETLARRLRLDLLACAEGIVRVAEAEMLRALRVMSVERGLDPRRFALMGFGGAGPLHAISLAQSLGIREVLCPKASGVLCALGLAAAAPRRDAARTVMLSGEQLTGERLRAECEALIDRARRGLKGGDLDGDHNGDGDGDLEGERSADAQVRVLAEMRYRGQSFELAVDATGASGTDEVATGTAGADDATGASGADGIATRAAGANGAAADVIGAIASPEALCDAFHAAHLERYGYEDREAEVELVTLRVSAWGSAPRTRLTARDTTAPAEGRAAIVIDGQGVEARCLRGELPPGTTLVGPAVCALPEATLFVRSGWSGTVDAHGTAILRMDEGTAPQSTKGGTT